LRYIPLGAELNLGLQVVALVLILMGLRYAIRTHKGYASGTDAGSQQGTKSEKTHKNLMTTAVLVSGIGVLIWMMPNLLYGWFYNQGGLGYGSGGYLSYFVFSGVYNSHWYLIAIMAIVGSVTAFLGVYLVLRMRWSRFPQVLAVQNFRAVMIVTWTMWFLNLMVGFLVFYFFVLVGAG
jgi:hypothetical protein